MVLTSRLSLIVLFSAILFIGGCGKTDKSTTEKIQTAPQQNQQTPAPQQNQQTPVPQSEMSPIQLQQQPPDLQQQQQRQKIQGASNKRVALFKCPQMNSEEIDAKITQKLQKVKGVLDVKANHINTFLIKVLYDGDKTSHMLIRDAIKEAGYESELSDDKEMK